LLTLGRANLDLYAQQPGVAFADVSGWDAMVGGSPVNVALAAAKLQLKAAVLTAVGDDLVGDWVLRALRRQRVGTRFVVRKSGPHTSLALRAQVRPDHPLAFYRHDPADIHLTPEDVAVAPLEEVPAVLVSADALARGTMVETCRTVMARARAGAATLYLDLDLRDVSWPSGEAYAAAVEPAALEADVVIGNSDEFATLLGVGARADHATIAAAAHDRLVAGAGRVVIVKHGDEGATVFAGGRDALTIPAFEVTEASSVGAGDSFAAGVIRARLNDADWDSAARFGSACAAITVSRYGCSSGFPRLEDTVRFLRNRQAGVTTEVS
jgi:5-dehydro-2-deoxygluconokinase